MAVPLFSLRSDSDFGIGEFHDLIDLADWCVVNKLKIIQLLPINDTTAYFDWHDSYPYNAISAFALNPVYLNLQDLGVEADKVFNEEQNQLNALPFVDYPNVLKTKWKYLKTAFVQQWETLQKSEDFKSFFAENEDWLVPYAEFCAAGFANALGRVFIIISSTFASHFSCCNGDLRLFKSELEIG